MRTTLLGVTKGITSASVLAIALTAAVAGGVSATTHEVPYDCASIQACVDMAAPGDTVYVYSGTYHEHVSINKQLALLGEDRATTVIDGGGSGTVVYVSASDVVVSGFTVRDGFRGIDCQSVARSDISNCTVVHQLGDGIRLSGSPNSEVRNCDVSDTYGTEPYVGYALNLNGSSNCYIEGIRISGSACHRASALYHSSGTVVRDLEITACANKSVVAGFGTYDLAGLYIHDTVNGVQFNGASGGRLADSVFRSIENVAVHLTYHSQGNVIEDNVIESSGWGVGWGFPGVRDNRFHHNDFIGNTVQVGDPSPGYAGAEAQYWDDGYPSGGNYWSDYSGDDLMSGPGQDIPGSDGIGDTPYWMTALAADVYPLMAPCNLLEATLDFDPDVVNCRSSGPVTCYVELPEGSDPADIDIATVMLNNTIPALTEPTSVGDHDLDGTPDVMVKFSRADVIDLLPEGEEVEVVVGGALVDDTAFAGADVIRVICKGPPRDANSIPPPPLKVISGSTGSSTTISYAVSAAGSVTLRVYDISGRLVRTLVSGHRTVGHYDIDWDERSDAGRSVGSGVYFIRLDGGGEIVAAKVVILR